MPGPRTQRKRTTTLSAAVPMSYVSHVLATGTTAVYPGAGTGSMGALTYVALGLMGEAAEAVEKEHDTDPAGLAAELGDVLWYLSRMALECGSVAALAEAADLPAAERGPFPGSPVTALVVDCGRVGEIIKKAVGAGRAVLTTEQSSRLEQELTFVRGRWAWAVHASGLDPAAVAAANLAKLSDRRERGVLQGSGDTR